MSGLVRLPLLCLQVWLAVLSGYLALLSLASFFYRLRKPAEQVTPDRRFAVLVPAHNEEAVLGRLLESTGRLDYPAGGFDVYVVADNCTDRTAALALEAGAIVFERFDAIDRGKGPALYWLLQRIDLAAYDAVIIVDADAVVSPNLLRTACAARDQGYRAFQFYDGVLNRDESPAAGLRALAFDLHNRVRPMGQAALGISAGLMGNGMGLATELMREGRWEGFGLAEDMDAHANLVAHGERVHYIDEASALAEMPNTLDDSEGQNVRWEAGRVAVARRHVPRLVRRAVQQRDGAALATALELTLPPQSVQLSLAGAGLLTSAAAGSRLGKRLGLAAFALQALYLGLGLLRLGRAGVRFTLLWHIPGYMAWKLRLYARVLTGGTPTTWTRGHRAGETAEAAGRAP